MGKEEIAAVSEVINSGWIGMGPKTEQFEKDFANYITNNSINNNSEEGNRKEVLYAVATNSATAALHLALRATGIKEGDEVITSPMTFASTVEAILYNGATPVFADIEYGTMNINTEDIKKKITPRTKAILPVHFGGHPCDMEAIRDIALHYNLSVIEDAAHACGASYPDGKKVGFNNLTCFSFHAVKNLAMGDGGMITTKSYEIAQRLKKMRWMGISKDTYQRSDGKYKWDYDIVEQGWKYHPNDIACAIGIEQLKKLDKMNARRREIAAIYDREFRKEPFKDEIDIPEVKESVNGKMVHARHNYVIKLKTKDREGLIAHLAEQGISAGVHYKPIYLHPRYKQYDKMDTPVAEELYPRIITLPVYPDMFDTDVYRVIKCIEDFIKR